MSWIKGGGTAGWSGSFIGGGGTGPVTPSNYWGAGFWEPQFFNSMFWNRRSTPVPPSGLGFFNQEFFTAQFFFSKFWNRKG